MDFSIILLILILLVLMIPSLIIQRKQRRHLDTIRQLQENLIIGDVIITTVGNLAGRGFDVGETRCE